MTIAYVAYTQRNVLKLDREGVCVEVEPLAGRVDLRPHDGHGSSSSDRAEACVGAQYVAAIDPSEPGGLVRMPGVGMWMLFAAVDPNGRIYCVRVGPLTHFDSCAAEDASVTHTPNGTLKLDSAARRPDDSLPPSYPPGFPGPRGKRSRAMVRTAPLARPPWVHDISRDEITIRTKRS
jgi:hypothetical protein